MKIIAVTGQTATGKTDFALEKAIETQGELVNFDSRQVYRHLDIITGKDFGTKNFRKTEEFNGFDIGCYSFTRRGKSIRVWLYDMADPASYFSSFDYAETAKRVIRRLMDAGKTPVLVGGTYLYLYHLLYEVETHDIPPDFALRKELNGLAVEKLQMRLSQIDKTLWDKLNTSDRKNPQRLIRKIEIAAHYGKRGREVPQEMRFALRKFFRDIDLEIYGLAFGKREDVRQRISGRVQSRIQNGAFEETESLLGKGYTGEEPGLRTIGYSQIIRHYKGTLPREEAIEEWINREVQYTKRQLTFMKKDPNITWRYV